MGSFRVRLNCIDHYQATPSELDPDFSFDSKQNYKVPIIRIFGATESGQKVCAHVHGFFPYLYVDYTGSLKPEDVDVFIHRFRMSVDHALAVSYRRDQSGSKAVFVAHISLIKGTPFYGYHVGYRPYLKIYLLNPLNITRLADLLRQGAVMGQNIQPYESHMQYVPQWMSDYNLYGCEYMDCQRVRFRSPVPDVNDLDPEIHKWHSLSIPSRAIQDEIRFPRQSHCAIEIDVRVQHIMNRHAVKQRHLHHDFSEAIKSPEYAGKLVPSMETLWKDESKRRRLRMGLIDPDSSPFEPEILISVSAEARENSGEWIHEEEFRQHIRQLAAQEMARAGNRKVTYDNFTLDNARVENLRSAFDSIEDLYPAKLQEALSSQGTLSRAQTQDTSESRLDVDEVKIRSFGDLSDIDDLDVPTNAKNSNSTPTKPESQTPRKKSKVNRVRFKEDELEQMGVRRAGDYTHAAEDEFEIPEEYTESIASSTPTQNGLKRGSRQQSESPKKRKMNSNVQEADSLKSTSFDAPTSISFASAATSDLVRNRFDDSMKEIATQVAKRLPFPVVKDPNHPSTLERLSQRSEDGSDMLKKSHGTGISSDFKASTGTRTTFSGLLPGSQATESFDAIPPSTQPSSRLEWKERSLPGFDGDFLCLSRKPPSASDVVKDLSAPGAISEIYRAAHYSNEHDVPTRKFQYGGIEYFPGSYSIPYLPDFDPWNDSLMMAEDQPIRFPNHKADEQIYKECRKVCTIRHWEIEELPPSRKEVEEWLKATQATNTSKEGPTTSRAVRNLDFTQVMANTQENNGAKYFQSDNEKATTSVRHEAQYMSVMSLEVHVNTRGSLVPNPEQDEVSAVFWRLHDDLSFMHRDKIGKPKAGIIVQPGSSTLARQLAQMTDVEVNEEDSEHDLFNRTIDVVRDMDPDIVTGFEVHGTSWGYMIERARLKFDWGLCDEFSRVRTNSHGRFGKAEDRWGFNQTSTVRITGRHTINVWRAMQSEINLLQYTMENIMFHLFNRRVPHYSYADLTRWWKSDKAGDVAKVVKYLLDRTQHDLDILDRNDLVPRVSEQARLLGVDFYSVFARGSQFKVESLMFRIAKPENFILVSPSRKQVGEQNALECLPLVMEPNSGFYNSPLVVLDFQSLYPSVMIAYNYCYSTFLGRIVDWRGRNKMGFASYDRQAQMLELLKDHINVAPNGMMYCTPKVRKSLLAKMLGEILETRVMVKSGMKQDKGDKPLQRLLNNRQLALKFIANVTYGYTSASFSGRMPCSEIADSIVQTGRETLEKAIMLIHSVEKWGAEVVYGDTDSLFIYLKGKTRDQAFTIGQEIADSITAVNPKPIKLKFEKVYHPCVLLAKKRYVGFKYEHRKQKEPEFDAKGIETVRRDGTPAEQRIEEKALKLLFRTQDLSQIKRYFQTQCSKIMRGNVSIQDFCFAKEVKLGTYSDKTIAPPGALISTRRMLEDPRAEPQYGERVPYVVITGAPGARLADRCVPPEELLRSPHLELDADYYINKNLIPPLERIFNLVGANVRQWYEEMPKYHRARSVPIGAGAAAGAARSLMENYMRRAACITCGEKLEGKQVKDVFCRRCAKRKDVATLTIRTRLNKAEKEVDDLEKVCRSCAGLRPDEEVKCDSKACPVFYSRTRHKSALVGTRGLLEPVLKRLEEGIEW